MTTPLIHKAFIAISFCIIITSITFTGCDRESTEEGAKIIAHRGAMVERPENTMAAFKRAVELGADIIEIDIRTSRDGRLYILHDANLDRTTDREGNASGFTLDEMQRFDAGSWFDPVYSSEIIPSFREVLEWASENDVVLLLDLKETGWEFAQAVTGEVQTAGKEETVVIGVRTLEQAEEFSQLLPNSPQLAFMRSPDDIEEYAEAGVDVIRLWLSWLDDDPALAERVRQSNTKLMINGTVGYLEETKELMSYQPDWILIDDLAQLQRSMDELALDTIIKNY